MKLDDNTGYTEVNGLGNTLICMPLIDPQKLQIYVKDENGKASDVFEIDAPVCGPGCEICGDNAEITDPEVPLD